MIVKFNIAIVFRMVTIFRSDISRLYIGQKIMIIIPDGH